MTATAFCQNRVLCMELESGLEGSLVLAISIDTHISSSNTLYAAVFIVENFRGRKAWKDLRP